MYKIKVQCLFIIFTVLLYHVHDNILQSMYMICYIRFGGVTMEYESKKRARAAYAARLDLVRVVMDIPRSLRDDIRNRATNAGMSLTSYILYCVSAAAASPLGSSDDAAGSPPGS